MNRKLFRRANDRIEQLGAELAIAETVCEFATARDEEPGVRPTG